MKERFRDINFRKNSLALIEQANGIIDEYMTRGYTLTVRQLYYQMVARGLIENNAKSYNRVQKTISDGRLAGLIDWDAIQDRTRYLRVFPSQTSPSAAIARVAAGYFLNKWENQPCYLEVWTEKDALIDVVRHGCSATETPFFSCRGYSSQSGMMEAAARFRAKRDREGRVILYLGDHDPSGLDMTRYIRESMQEFGADVEVVRIALNMDQIQALNPPPNPAKESDTRCKGYVQKYGALSWELDAIDPDEMAGLINMMIKGYMDTALFDETCKRQEHDRHCLSLIAANYSACVAGLGGCM